ncbi:MAG TPA: 7-carboxy-7-deazaguanine synthase QueE [Deltaproteobacteria bacterium]|nr:7-carboxy-7-deazaguanine synthase QueE [Deltaproteobacteria bacterium]
MKVTEIFYSLQGEGVWLGKPAVFLRLGGCLAPYCPWCDTRYAWDEARDMDQEAVLASMARYDCRTVVITGGEPLMQWDELAGLHERLIERGYAIQYETSGKAGIPPIEGATVVCSPKYIDHAWRIEPQTLSRAHYFKFIYHDRSSEQAIMQFIKDHHLAAERVYIMPEGSTRRAQLGLMAQTFEFCRQQGLAMTPRLHILAFDARRGV